MAAPAPGYHHAIIGILLKAAHTRPLPLNDKARGVVVCRYQLPIGEVGI